MPASGQAGAQSPPPALAHAPGMDACKFEVAYGLRGQVALFYVKDLRIERFRCLDLGKLP